MSLFVCEECDCVENTATAGVFGYHGRSIKPSEIDIDRDPKLAAVKGDGKARCSECNPAIGRWHGLFPKLTEEEWRAENPDSPRGLVNREPV